MTSFKVRPAQDRDAEAMAAIAASNPTAPQWTVAQLNELLQPHNADSMLCRIVLVAEEEGEIAGFAVASALCAVFPPEAELESLAVHPALQGRGIGWTLLQAAVDWVAAQQAETVRLEVRESNGRALGIYRKAGFHQTGLRPGYYAAPVEDAIVMERTLLPRPTTSIGPAAGITR